jgi:hypothetical protein
MILWDVAINACLYYPIYTEVLKFIFSLSYRKPNKGPPKQTLSLFRTMLSMYSNIVCHTDVQFIPYYVKYVQQHCMSHWCTIIKVVVYDIIRFSVPNTFFGFNYVCSFVFKI